MKQIIIVSDMIPPGYGGAGMAAYKHACKLNQEGKLYCIITRTPEILPKGFPGINQFDPTELLKLRIHRMAPKSSFLLTHKFGSLKRIIPLIINNFKLFFVLLRLLIVQRKSYNIIHCYSTTWLSLFSTIISKVLRKKIILEMSLVGHDDPRSVSANDRIRIKYILKRFQFKLSDRVISKSLALSEEYLMANLDPEKLVLIPYSIDNEAFNKPSAAIIESLKKHLNIARYSPLILFVGSVTTRKGVDIAFKTLPILRVLYPDAGLLIIGNDSTRTDDPELNKIVQEIKSNPDSGIILKDPVENIKDFMFVSDIFLFPSRREGFGIVIIEAMAAELPVIVKRIPGVTDYIIDSQEYGILVDSEDEKEYAAHISHLLEHVEDQKSKIEKAKNRVKDYFDTSMIENQYIQLYNSISRNET